MWVFGLPILVTLKCRMLLSNWRCSHFYWLFPDFDWLLSRFAWLLPQFLLALAWHILEHRRVRIQRPKQKSALIATDDPTMATINPALSPPANSSASNSMSPSAPTASAALDTNSLTALEALFDKKLAPLHFQLASQNKELQSKIATLQEEITMLHSAVTPASSPRALPTLDDTGKPPNLPLKTANTYTYLRAMGAAGELESATVPRIQSRTRLNSSGDFIEEDYDLSNTTSSIKSHRLENDIMDHQRGVSFREIGVNEKRDVFQLGAVRRSMRNLDYAELLLTKEALALSLKYMEVRVCHCVLAVLPASASCFFCASAGCFYSSAASAHPTTAPRSVPTVLPSSTSAMMLCRPIGRTPTTEQYAMRPGTSPPTFY